jgi:hypothetical protein
VKTKHFFDPEEVKKLKKEITTLVFIYRMVVLQRFLLLSSFLFLFPMWEFPAILFNFIFTGEKGRGEFFFFNFQRGEMGGIFFSNFLWI